MRFPWVLSVCVGFLSLSQEILWVRFVSFAYHSVPQSFSFVLAMFLLGIAAGALLGKRVCQRMAGLYAVSGAILVGGGVADMLAPLLAVSVNSHPFGVLVLAALIFLCACLKGIVFPVVHQLGSTPVPGKLGKSVSRVYFFNIVGSTLGPLLTGFWLLDWLGLQRCMVLMGGFTVSLGTACLARERGVKAGLAGALVLVTCITLMARRDDLAAKLAFSFRDAPIRRVIENRSGIIHVLAAQTGGDLVYGGNVYDGRTSVDLRVNSNGLHRVVVLEALRPHAERVLVLGMSTGAWTRILSGFPGVKKIDVIEINPGYLDLLSEYPQINGFLRDPRVTVHIDDARRWLRSHPDPRYDLIVMNTTFHWRAYSTNLLSQQFLELLKRHLEPGGLVTYNTTGSTDAVRTAEAVFPFAYRYVNFVIAGDQDFRPRVLNGAAALTEIKLDGMPVLDPGVEADAQFIRETLSVPFLTSADDIARIGRPAEIITDWNMITEFKYGHAFP